MARQKGNSVMHNTRGMFNKQVVFKERAGKIYVAEVKVSIFNSLGELIERGDAVQTPKKAQLELHHYPG